MRVALLGAFVRIVVFFSFIGWAAMAPVEATQSKQAQLALHFRAGQQAFQAGQLDRAVEEYKKVLQLDPSLVEAQVNLGLAYHALGHYDQAIAELEKAAQINPKLLSANLFLGIDYLKLGMNRKAAVTLRRALSIDPSNREARRALSTSELAQERYRDAAKEFRTIFSRETDQEEAWFNLGHDYLDLAKRLSATLTMRHQASAWAHRFSADSWSERQSWNDAAREYRSALHIDSRQPGLHSQLGMAYLRQGKADEAEGEFRAELQLDSHYTLAQLGMAETRLLQGHSAAALETISKIWDADPSFLAVQSDFPSLNLTPEAAARLAKDLGQPSRGSAPLARELPTNGAAMGPFHFLMSAILRAAGDTAGAQAEHDAFVRQFQQSQATHAQMAGRPSPEACHQHRSTECVNWLRARRARTFSDDLLLGETLLTLQEDERASDVLAVALGREPGNPAAVYWLLRAYKQLADDCFAHLAESFPDSWRIHQMQAELYLSREQNAQAIEEFQLALRKSPEDPRLHQALGELYLKKKLLFEARMELEKALQLDSTAARTLYLVGWLYVAERKPSEGIPCLQQALRRDPSLLEARAMLGRAYLHAGKAQLAVPELEKGIVLDHYGDLHFLLSEAYRQVGKPELAQQALARSQALRTASAEGDQARLTKAYEDEQ
jgi:tetratricopeptide (TPR) repeat protein